MSKLNVEKSEESIDRLDVSVCWKVKATQMKKQPISKHCNVVATGNSYQKPKQINK